MSLRAAFRCHPGFQIDFAMLARQSYPEAVYPSRTHGYLGAGSSQNIEMRGRQGKALVELGELDRLCLARAVGVVPQLAGRLVIRSLASCALVPA